MNLLIVESPKKASHIKQLLGAGWEVKATLGHIRDLPVSGPESRVLPPSFTMHYTIKDAKHRQILAKLKEAALRADKIFLASDPDREGEAIAWHVSSVLKMDPRQMIRVSYQEITESAIKKAIKNPRPINMRLVAAQEARRALDRIVGWEVSPVLSNTLGATASAGRVQTPALRLIVERERAIKAFRPTPYYEVLAIFPGGWRAKWLDGLKEGEFWQDMPYAESLANAVPKLPFMVSQSDSRVARRSPPPPFTTSTMQIDASRALRCGAEDIMKAAQSLFEAGHITYHRTDSPNLSEEGETMLRATLQKLGLEIEEKPRRWKAKGDAQEAHEAIRPTDSDKDAAGEGPIQQGLYDLIRKRALASQMPDALYQQTIVVLDAGTFQGRLARFKAVGSVLTNPGWKKLYQESENDDGSEEKEAANPVPKLAKGSQPKADRGELLKKTTKAPPRYTEATLIKALEDHGVGRPSTYAAILKTLYARKYMTRKGKSPALYPTEFGKAVVDALLPFDFAGIDYTRSVEEHLDEIAAGEASPKTLLSKAYGDLEKTLRTMPGGQHVPCPVEGCDGEVRRMESKKRKGIFFWVCSNRDAHPLLSDDDGKPGAPFAEAQPGTGPECPNCRVATAERTTAKGHAYFSCPKCHTAWWNDDGGLGKAWEREEKGKSSKKTRQKA